MAYSIVAVEVGNYDIIFKFLEGGREGGILVSLPFIKPWLLYAHSTCHAVITEEDQNTLLQDKETNIN